MLDYEINITNVSGHKLLVNVDFEWPLDYAASATRAAEAD